MTRHSFQHSLTINDALTQGHSPQDTSPSSRSSQEPDGLTPSAKIREQYYRLHQVIGDDDADVESSDETDLVGRPDAIIYAPLRRPGTPTSCQSRSNASIFSLRTDYIDSDDSRSLASIRTNDSCSQDIIHAPLSDREPKIVVEEMGKKKTRNKNYLGLLNRFTESTAPMRAKLSALSRTGQRLGSDIKGRTGLSSPLRRCAGSVFNLSTVSLNHLAHPKNGRSRSFSYDKPARSFIATAKGKGASSRSPPALVPALLSTLAVQLKEKVVIGARTKDSIQYNDVFDGREAVNKLAYLIDTKDRHLALLVGRALGAQGLFHDVHYERRLCDSETELYRFREHLRMHAATDMTLGEDTVFEIPRKEEREKMPSGVFTLLTPCYSPTCVSESPCYSNSCPRRMTEMQSHGSEDKRIPQSSSRTSLGEKQQERLWITTVPAQVSASLTVQDRKRQENIFELIYTEKDFVNDLAYIKEYWRDALLLEDCIEAERREAFIKELFWNISDVHSVNQKLLQALEARQRECLVVEQIGDIILDHVIHFEPFVHYGEHQVFSKFALEVERSANSAFAFFIQTTERLPQSRKLELNGYLTKPTTRLGRYNLLLREILRHTPKENPDHQRIPEAMEIIAGFLKKMNHKTGDAENTLNLQILSTKLNVNYGNDQGLDLKDKNRKILHNGRLKKKSTRSTEPSDVHVFLLDHYLVITKQKVVQGAERCKIYKKPIPLALLAIALPDQGRRASFILPCESVDGPLSAVQMDVPSTTSNKTGYPISFVYLGREGGTPITLYASTLTARRQWVETCQQALMAQPKVFDMALLNDRFFDSFNKVNCAATYAESTVIGSDQGVYIQKGAELVHVLAMEKVSQIDILGNSLVLVLADKALYTYTTEMLSGDDATGSKRGRKISNNVSFFKLGMLSDRQPAASTEPPVERNLVCYVKYSGMTSTIRALEPCASSADTRHSGSGSDGKKKTKRRKRASQRFFRRHPLDALKVYKDLYIPEEATSIQYFKNVICVGSSKGFQMVDMASAGVQSVLDPNDKSHDTLSVRDGLKPMSMFRHGNGTFLLCYSEMAFYIDKKGRRCHHDWTLQWAGNPTAFAFQSPFLIAFSSAFIEVRHVETGALVQVIRGNHIRCLKPDQQHGDRIYGAMEDRRTGNELIFELSYAKESLALSFSDAVFQGALHSNGISHLPC